MSVNNTKAKNAGVSTKKRAKKGEIKTWIYKRKTMDVHQIAEAAGMSPGGVMFRIRRSGASTGTDITSIIHEIIEVKTNYQSIKNDFDPLISFVYHGKKISFKQFVFNLRLRYESAKLYFAKLGVGQGDDITDKVDDNELKRIKMKEPTYYLYQGLLYTAKGLSRASGLEYETVVSRLERVNAKPGVDVSPIMKKATPRKSTVLTDPQWIYCGKKMTLQDIASATGSEIRLISMKLKKAGIEPGQDATLTIGGGIIAASEANKKLLPRWLFNGRKLTADEIAQQLCYKSNYVEMKIRASKIPNNGDVTDIFPDPIKIDKWMYKGKLVTAEQIAAITGRTVASVKIRIKLSGILPNESLSKLVGL